MENWMLKILLENQVAIMKGILAETMEHKACKLLREQIESTEYIIENLK